MSVNEKEMKALNDKGIKVGDEVKTSYRGGVRQGIVKAILTSTDETAHPPKVVFERERHGDVKEVQHNPSTLDVIRHVKGE